MPRSKTKPDPQAPTRPAAPENGGAKTLAIIDLATDKLEANEYNPNRMTKDEFRELVAEVRRLGRVPKPIVVRWTKPNRLLANETYVIVDGEHSWRAAREVGLKTVPCEVVQADEFEARLQTYKRNQHGTHDPIALGRMFEDMIAARGLSRRQLAREIGVSDGTVRNALAYADAVRVRNSYAPEGAAEAIADLSVRQVQTYLELPPPFGDLWIDHAAADPKKLAEAVCVPCADTGYCADDVKTLSFDSAGYDYESSRYESLRPIAEPPFVDIAKLCAKFDEIGFVGAVRKACRLWMYGEGHRKDFDGLDRYLPAVVALMNRGWIHIEPVEFVSERLLCRVDRDAERLVPSISPEDWTRTLEAIGRTTSWQSDLHEKIDAALHLLITPDDGLPPEDPRAILRKRQEATMPAFIRDAVSISSAEKQRLVEILKDGISGLTANQVQDVVAEAVHGHETHARFIREHSADHPELAATLFPLATRMQGKIDEIQREAEHAAKCAENDRIFGSRESMIAEFVTSHATKYTRWDREQLSGRPTIEVLRERLTALPTPELAFVTALALQDLREGVDYYPIGRWEAALTQEIEEAAASGSTEAKEPAEDV